MSVTQRCPTEHATQQRLCTNTDNTRDRGRAHLRQAGYDSEKDLAGLWRKSIDSDGRLLRFQCNEISVTCSSRTFTHSSTTGRQTKAPRAQGQRRRFRDSAPKASERGTRPAPGPRASTRVPMPTHRAECAARHPS